MISALPNGVQAATRKVSGALEKWRFARTAEGIRKTPPLDMKPGDIRFVSLLQHKDVTPYLVAIKSVYCMIGEGAVIVLNDGSLLDADMAVIRHHVPEVDFRHIRDVDTSGFQKGGCWERLLTILDVARDYYVIQVDADLVGHGEDEDLRGLYRSNIPFALGNKEVPGRVSFEAMSAWIEQTGWAPDHVAIAAERAMKHMNLNCDPHYIRGSAGFSGFPKGLDFKDHLAAFHREMERLVGPAWTEWGSEQVASNFVVATSGPAVELGPPHYVNNHPGRAVDQARLVHYFGTYRYFQGRYKRAAERVIASFKP